MSDLLERRSAFVYEGCRIAAIGAKAPIIPALWEDREEDFREQFLKVIERQMGSFRSSSAEEIHGSWMQAYLDRGWVYGLKYDAEDRIHPDLVAYAELGQLEKDKDAVFVLICEIARLYIREDE